MDDDSDGQLSDELTMHTTVRIARALNLYQLAKVTICQVPFVTTTTSSVVDIFSTATDTRVVLDCPLTMSSHVSSVCRYGSDLPILATCTVGLQLRSIRWSVTSESTRELVQAFVMCRLDYCNSLLAGVAYVHLQRLQPVITMQLVWSLGLDGTTTSLQ